MEKLLFSLVKLKTEFVASKEVAANNQFLSSTKFNGDNKEKFPFCLFNLKSSVSYGFFDCSINVSACVLIKSSNSLFN